MITVSQHIAACTESAKETTILTKAMKNSSGQWCANSVTSNRSLVILAISCPILVFVIIGIGAASADERTDPYACPSQCFAPIMWPTSAI